MDRTLEHVDEILKRIGALCSNPHWTSERRWTIERLAAEGRAHLEGLAQDIAEDRVEVSPDAKTICVCGYPPHPGDTCTKNRRLIRQGRRDAMR